MTAKIPPRMTADSAPYWEGCTLHELRYQYCAACQKPQFPPARHCRSCFKSELQWLVSKGAGNIHSLTHVHRAPSPAFIEDVPYTLALVDLDEGFRLMACVRGERHEEAKIGDRVHIIFEILSAEATLPQVKLD